MGAKALLGNGSRLRHCSAIAALTASWPRWSCSTPQGPARQHQGGLGSGARALWASALKDNPGGNEAAPKALSILHALQLVGVGCRMSNNVAVWFHQVTCKSMRYIASSLASGTPCDGKDDRSSLARSQGQNSLADVSWLDAYLVHGQGGGAGPLATDSIVGLVRHVTGPRRLRGLVLHIQVSNLSLELSQVQRLSTAKPFPKCDCILQTYVACLPGGKVHSQAPAISIAS